MTTLLKLKESILQQSEDDYVDVQGLTKIEESDIRNFFYEEIRPSIDIALDQYADEVRRETLEEAKVAVGEMEDVKSNTGQWLAPEFEIPLRNQLRQEILAKLQTLPEK